MELTTNPEGQLDEVSKDKLSNAEYELTLGIFKKLAELSIEDIKQLNTQASNRFSEKSAKVAEEINDLVVTSNLPLFLVKEGVTETVPQNTLGLFMNGIKQSFILTENVVLAKMLGKKDYLEISTTDISEKFKELNVKVAE